jgi:hypothetical protein
VIYFHPELAYHDGGNDNRDKINGSEKALFFYPGSQKQGKAEGHRKLDKEGKKYKKQGMAYGGGKSVSRIGEESDIIGKTRKGSLTDAVPVQETVIKGKNNRRRDDQQKKQNSRRHKDANCLFIVHNPNHVFVLPKSNPGGTRGVQSRSWLFYDTLHNGGELFRTNLFGKQGGKIGKVHLGVRRFQRRIPPQGITLGLLGHGHKALGNGIDF